MLANLLPGLRHTRTPLVAGTLWLLIAWLVLGDRILPEEDGGRIEGLLHQAGTLVGASVMLAGLGLLATLVGGVIPCLPIRWIARRLPINMGHPRQLAVCWFFGIEPDLAAAKGDFGSWVFRRVSLAPKDLAWSSFTGKECPPNLQMFARDIQEEGSARIGGERMSNSDFAGGDPDPWDWLRWGLAEAAIEEELANDLPLQLHAERESLFLEYDRIRAESELRGALAVPLTILIAMLLTESLLWLPAFVVPVWLLRQAVQLFVEADLRLLSAVRNEVIRSSTIAFVDSLSEARKG